MTHERIVRLMLDEQIEFKAYYLASVSPWSLVIWAFMHVGEYPPSNSSVIEFSYRLVEHRGWDELVITVEVQDLAERSYTSTEKQRED